MKSVHLQPWWLLGIMLWVIVGVGQVHGAAVAEPQPPPVARFEAWWPTCEAQTEPSLPASLQQRITAAARAYIAPDQEAAQQVANRLGFAPNPHPSNMCGPLAVAILRDAGIVQTPRGLAPYWLLDPRENAHLLYHLFPPRKFCYRHFSEAPFQVDFRQFPLHVGDFLYLYAGHWGTFEHIMVVTRVDEQGRAYAVTNLNTRPEEYYVVREVMLYDPQHPGEGMFATWADYHHAAIGLTGFGGFDLWRPLKGQFGADDTPAPKVSPLPPPHPLRLPRGALPQPQ